MELHCEEPQSLNHAEVMKAEMMHAEELEVIPDHAHQPRSSSQQPKYAIRHYLALCRPNVYSIAKPIHTIPIFNTTTKSTQRSMLFHRC